MTLDEKDLPLKDQANIRILLQVSQGNQEPVILVKVLHLSVFIKRAAAKKITIDIPEEMSDGEEEDDDHGENDSNGDSDAEVQVKKKAAKKVTKKTNSKHQCKEESGDDESGNNKSIREESPLHPMKVQGPRKDGHKEVPHPHMIQPSGTQPITTVPVDGDTDADEPPRKWAHLDKGKRKDQKGKLKKLKGDA